MDFRGLSYILAIAKYGNITKAAEALYVGQPTLSKFLMNLEAELGLKLFKRVGNRYVLTYAGERYAEKAAQILNLKKDLDAEMLDIVKQDKGVLNIAFANRRYSYVLPLTLPEFSKIYPNVKLNLFRGSSDENDLHLLNGEIELAFYTAPSNPNPQIEYEPLIEEELLICTAENHRLKQLALKNPDSPYPKLNLSMLKGERILMMKPDQRTRQIIDVVLKQHKIEFNNVLYIENIQAIVELVSIGYGVSFIFEPHIKFSRHTKPIECYSLGEHRIVSNFVAAKRKGSYLQKYALHFIEITKNMLARELGVSNEQ